MPKGTRVHDCVQKLIAAGKSKGSAIAICQKSTGQNYQTGKASETLMRAKRR